MSKLDFEELEREYERCLELAKSKLPSVSDIDIPEFIIPIMPNFDLKVKEFELKDYSTTANDKMLYFRFRKQLIGRVVIGWELIR